MNIRSALMISTVFVMSVIVCSVFAGPRTPHNPYYRQSLVKFKAVIPTQRDIVPIMALASQRRIAVEHDQQVAFADAVQRAQDAQTAAQAAQSVPAPVTAIPAAWVPTAMCEEGMRDDPNYGYFGIQEWNGFGGYSNAGAAPLSVQLQWEYTYQHYPPDAPGQCHSY